MSSRLPSGYKRLEDYGVIGNLETCALVGKDGSIDWCCFPHLESPSVFAALLDSDKGGHFYIQPKENFESIQSYLEKTNILQTHFKTKAGTITITDFMPISKLSRASNKNILLKYWMYLKNFRNNSNKALNSCQTILRKITCTRGKVELEVDFKPRLNYARAVPFVHTVENGVVAKWNEETLFLQSPIPLQIKEGRATGKFILHENNTGWFVFRYGNRVPISFENCENLLDKTIGYWQDWAHDCEREECVFDGPWHDLAVRSGLVLKLLTHPATGAIAAAPTTSLPEEIGGVRNWDYRFSWIRDSSFTIQALYNLGHLKEGKDYLKWFLNICRNNDPSEIRVLYGLHGEVDSKEEELDHLSGYRNSRPVRIGNAAVEQRQLDIYGELINAVYEVNRYENHISKEDWYSIKKIVDYVCRVWETKDAGIWEIRGKPRHFVHSKLMCWVALDRGIKLSEMMGFNAQLKLWRKNREEIRQNILKKGFNKELNSFVQYFNGETLDASTLLIPVMEFLPADDPRVQGTIDATLKRLMTKEGLVYRYEGEDGLPGNEGTFVLCSFWLVNALTLSNRIEEAEKIFLNILDYASPLGLLAEEIDAELGEQLGNFPQAFSHIGLINNALYLGKAKGKKQMGPEPIGSS